MVPERHRGVPEDYNLIPAKPLPRRTPAQRAYWVLRTSLILFVILAIFAYVGGSVYMAADVGDAPRDVPQVQDQLGSNVEAVGFHSRGDGIVLEGWLVHAAHPNGRSVIMVSGWKSTRVNVVDVPVGHDLVAHGYDLLLFDTRGAGASLGARQTLGNLEQHDVLGAYDFLKGRGYAPNRMTVYGFSAGAATAILAAPQISDVAAFVCDSSYDNLRPLLEQQWSARTHLVAATDWLAIQVAKFFDINPDLRPIDTVREHPERAFLFFHAQGDGLIPVADSVALKGATSNPQSVLLVVAQGTAHLDTYAREPALYLSTLYGFINQQISSHGG